MIISLTSIEPDLIHTGKVIRAIKAQTDVRVELYLSDNIDYNLYNVQGAAIDFVKDMGPSTKLLYSLQRHHGEDILTFDADMLPLLNCISTIMAYAKKFPNYIVSNFGHEMYKDGRLQPLVSGRNVVNGFAPNAVKGVYHKYVMAQGCGTIYYPGKINEQLYQDGEIFHIPDYMKYNDDLWFYLNEQRLGIVDVVIMREHIRLADLGKDSGLHMGVNVDNDIYRKQQVRYCTERGTINNENPYL